MIKVFAIIKLLVLIQIYLKLKEKIYLINPKMKNKQLYFIAEGNIINERVSLAANKIKDETTILIDQQDFD